MLELVPESGERRFLVHRDLLASQSEYLGLLVGSTPTTPRQIDIGLWDTETLAQFVEYIYTNDYQSPDPVSVLATPVVTPGGGSTSGHYIRVRRPMLEAMPERNREFEDPQGQIRPLIPLSKCLSASDLDPPRKLSAAERPNEKRFDPAGHDFEDVFLAHAKIYALALKLGIKALRSLALRRLLETLTGIGPVKPHMPVIGNFVDLARYTYSRTNSPEDPLRRIVSQFAALNFTVLQTKQMRELMSEGGDFPGDLMEKASKRFVASEEGETYLNAILMLKEAVEVWTEGQGSLRREIDRLGNLVKTWDKSM